MKKSLTIILMITILIMPLVFAIRITGSAPQNEEDVENYEEDFCEINDCDEHAIVTSEENSITEKATEENNSKGLFEKLIDWIKDLLS
jgi:hypothetical protein